MFRPRCSSAAMATIATAESTDRPPTTADTTDARNGPKLPGAEMADTTAARNNWLCSPGVFGSSRPTGTASDMAANRIGLNLLGSYGRLLRRVGASSLTVVVVTTAVAVAGEAESSVVTSAAVAAVASTVVAAVTVDADGRVAGGETENGRKIPFGAAAAGLGSVPVAQ